MLDLQTRGTVTRVCKAMGAEAWVIIVMSPDALYPDKILLLRMRYCECLL